MPLSSELIGEVAAGAAGDIRCAINSLQFQCLRNREKATEGQTKKKGAPKRRKTTGSLRGNQAKASSHHFGHRFDRLPAFFVLAPALVLALPP